MKRFSKFFFASAALAMIFTGCSNEEPVNVVSKEGNVHAQLTLQLPEGSRATTTNPDDNTNSSDGFEIGKDHENNVGSVLVVLASKNESGAYDYVTSNLADAHPAANNGNRPTYNVQFETRDLISNAGENIFVFAFCNPTTKLVAAAEAKFPEGFVDAIGNIADASISVANGFFMSNAAIVSKQLPTLDDMNKKYNTPENPFPLGTVKVQRATARFDFKQTKVDGQDENNLYPIYNQLTSEEGNKQLMGYVKLDGMALFNEALNYYYLPRVSADGTNEKADLCGPEIPGIYVVSPFATEKTATPLSLNFIREKYRYNGQPEEGETSTGMIFKNLNYEALGTNLGEDNDDNWGPDNKGIKDYMIWKYVTENTIPTVNAQRKGITTGIAFKGHIQAVAGTELATAMNGTNVIYGYAGVLRGDLKMLKDAVKKNPVSTLAETFKAQFGIEEITDEALAGVTEDLTSTVKGGLTIYKPENGQYPVYYAYYNRHDDNGYNTIMQAMEFSVVRNNVYKIAVSDILEFGHPGDPGEDPDPENPENPDETPKTYFRVNVQVLPWVVRINNIIL